MERLILFILIITLASCNSIPKTHTVYEKNFVPINVVPEPPTHNRPTLEIHDLSDGQLNNDKELVKAYKISLHQLFLYTNILETIVGKYKELSIDSKQVFDILEKFNTAIPIPLSASENNTIEVIEYVSKPDFDFTYEYKMWEVKNDFKRIQDEIDKLNESDYKE